MERAPGAARGVAVGARGSIYDNLRGNNLRNNLQRHGSARRGDERCAPA